MAPSRTSTFLTLLTLLPFAVSRSVYVPIPPQAALGEDCTTISQPGGGKLISCPGCTRIIDKDGDTVLKSGPNCPKDDDDEETSTPPPKRSDTSDCPTVALPNGDIALSCPGCRWIHDEDGFVITQTGRECDKYEYMEEFATHFGPGTSSVEHCATLRPGVEADGGETLLDCLGCRKFVDEYRRTHMECPGCRIILNAQGRLISQIGHRCSEYWRDLPVFKGRGWKVQDEDDGEADDDIEEEDDEVMPDEDDTPLNEHYWTSEQPKEESKEPDYDGCTVVRKKGDKRVVVCLGCVIVYDGDGKETVRTGWRCSDYETTMNGMYEQERSRFHEVDVESEEFAEEASDERKEENMEL